MPRLFDIFVQGAVPIDRSQGGLGIGLSLVRELVTLHGGSVAAQSDGPGQGSRFTVHLPRAIGEARDVDGERDGQAQRGDASDAGGDLSSHASHARPCTILLVEDNEDARQMVAATLAGQGHTVLETTNGADGLQVAMATEPEIAIIDIGLPGVDGYELARRLRTHPHTRAIALIALTGYGQKADRRRALEAGFDLHLVKPARADRLLDAIRHCQSRERPLEA